MKIPLRILCIMIFLLIPGINLFYSCSPQSGDNGYPEPDEPYVKTTFRDDFNTDQIDTSVWQIATWAEHGGQTGLSRCYALDGYMHMVFINDSTDGYLSAAIQTRDEFYYGTWKARIKPTDIPGVLNSMYTIDWNNTLETGSDSDGTRQEIDIEFLTYTFAAGSPKVHFAVHESEKESFETNPDINLDFDPSADFHVWGFEITPAHIRWFVDDQVLLTYSYNGNPIAITAPYQLKLNVWSSVNWINGPPAEDVECVYLIDWIEFTPYK